MRPFHFVLAGFSLSGVSCRRPACARLVAFLFSSSAASRFHGRVLPAKGILALVAGVLRASSSFALALRVFGTLNQVSSALRCQLGRPQVDRAGLAVGDRRFDFAGVSDFVQEFARPCRRHTRARQRLAAGCEERQASVPFRSDAGLVDGAAVT